VQAITDDLVALLKSRLQAGASGFRARLEVDTFSSSTVNPVVEPFANQVGGGSTLTVPITTLPEAGHLLVGLAGAQHSGGTGIGDYYEWPAGWTVIDEGFHPSWASAGGDTLGLFSLAYRIADGTETSVAITAHVAGLQRNHALIVNYGVKPTSPYLVDHAWLYPDSPTHQAAPAMPSVTVPGGSYLLIAGIQERPDYPIALPAGYAQTAFGSEFDIGYTLAHRVLVDTAGGAMGGTLTATGAPGTGSYPDPLWTIAHAAFKLPPVETSSKVTQSLSPKSVSIDRSLRQAADQLTADLANESLPLGWGPSSLIPTNSRCRAYQWYGDPANEVQTFTGVVDIVRDTRDPLTTQITARDMMAILLDQTFSATAPQKAGEAGAVRTAANGVYLSLEVSAVVSDILDRAGWPSADRAIEDTSYTLDEYIVQDGWSWADAIIGNDRLTGLTGYSAWADELGVFHFAPTVLEGSLTDPGAPAYTFRSGEDILSLSDETDQYVLRTRVKVRGPLTTTTLTDTWREVWRTSKFRYPVGLWYAPGEPTILRVLDRGTKRMYRLRQSDRAVLGSVYLGSAISYPLGLSGDPSDATVYWVLNAPWLWGSGSSSSIKKVRKSDNVVLATYTLSTDHWSAIKVSGSYVYVTNLSTDRVYRRSKSTGAAVDSFSHTYGSTTQLNPSGIMIDGTTVYVFWSNAGTTARFLKCAEAAPGTVTGVVKTAGTVLHGGEMDTTTHTECYGDSDSLGLVAKFTLLAAVSQTTQVFAEVVDTDLEDELGTLAQSEPRVHDTHPLDAAHPFEVRRDTVTLTPVISLAQATETAARRLDMLARRRRVLDAAVLGNPALQKTDLVRLEDPVTGVSTQFVVDTVRSGMDSTGTYATTLGLLPLTVPGDTPTDDGSAS